MKRKGKTRISASPVHGVLLVDKPRGPTSRRVLDDLEDRLRLGGIGHSGTLDPLASGLLVCLAGVARRLQDVFMGSRKRYLASIRFGETSETLDGEGPVAATGIPVPGPLEAALGAVLGGFRGRVLQAPPGHSAIRLGGRRAYDFARAGKPRELPPRPVEIFEIALLATEGATADLLVECGPGTYIRSLARDLGEALGCGAWLAGLRRTASGLFSVDDAVEPGSAEEADVLPLARALSGFPRIDVDAGQGESLACGRMLDLSGQDGGVSGDPVFAWSGGEPLCRLKRTPGGQWHSRLLLRK